MPLALGGTAVPTICLKVTRRLEVHREFGFVIRHPVFGGGFHHEGFREIEREGGVHLFGFATAAVNAISVVIHDKCDTVFTLAVEAPAKTQTLRSVDESHTLVLVRLLPRTERGYNCLGGWPVVIGGRIRYMAITNTNRDVGDFGDVGANATARL